MRNFGKYKGFRKKTHRYCKPRNDMVHKFMRRAAYIKIDDLYGPVQFCFSYNSDGIRMIYDILGNNMRLNIFDTVTLDSSFDPDEYETSGAHLTGDFLLIRRTLSDNLGVCRWCGVYAGYSYNTRREKWVDIHRLYAHVDKCKRRGGTKAVSIERILALMTVPAFASGRTDRIVRECFTKAGHP